MAYSPTFNGDSAFMYVQKQVSFGPRVPGTPAHEACAAYLETTLKRFIPEVTIQQGTVKTYEDKTLSIKNIIASYQPERTDRVLLCAHWDSRHVADHDPDPANHQQPILGANDGASGVGVLLEIARQLSITDPGIGVDIVLFDAEDHGQPESVTPSREDTWCLGSQYWSKNPHKPGYTARFGILLDMVGGHNATFAKEETSMSFAPGIVGMVWETARQLGYTSYFLDEESGGVTDDHLYINQNLKIPTVDIIQQDLSNRYSFFEHWHTVKDDMSAINQATLTAVGNTVLAVLHLQKAG